MGGVAFALAGGFAHGSFEVGAVRYLYDQGIRPDILCGTSVGALNAIKLAEGEGDPSQGLPGLESLWLGLRRTSDVYINGPFLSYLHDNYPDVYNAIPNLIIVPDPDPPPGLHIVARNIGTPLPSMLIKTLTAPGRATAFVGFWLVQAAKGIILFTDLISIINEFTGSNPIAFFDQSPVLQLLKKNLSLFRVNHWITAGGKLRFATVGHESGKVRYANEAGQLVERDNATVVFNLPVVTADDPACQNLADAVDMLSAQIAAMVPPPILGDPRYIAYMGLKSQLQALEQSLNTCRQSHPPVAAPDFRIPVNASCALPSFLVPQVMGGESYVDGGIRDVMPVAMAAQLGARQIFAVNDTTWLGSQSAPTNFLDIAERALMGVAIDEVAYRCATAVTDPAVTVWSIQCTYAEQNDGYTIHPAYIRINISYGYMRAADTVHPAPVRPERCYQLSDDIARMRRLIFQFEAAACTPPVSTITINTLQLRWAKGILGALIAERAALGGPMPQDVLDSWTTWEES